jgi:hypothetical protein
MSQAYDPLLVDRLSGHIADRGSRRLAWIGDRYRKLAQTNRLIVEVRERIKRQKAQIRILEHEDRSTRRATACDSSRDVASAERASRRHLAKGARLSTHAARRAHAGDAAVHRGVPMSSPALRKRRILSMPRGERSRQSGNRRLR